MFLLLQFKLFRVCQGVGPSGRRSGTPAAGNEDPGGGVERGEDAGGQRETQGGA